MVRVLIFGRRGYLAHRFSQGFAAFGATIRATVADVTDPTAVMEAVAKGKPDLVLNAAGKTHSPTHATIDGCEEDNAAKYQTFKVNVDGAFNVRFACQMHGVPLVHLGSGCIFDGHGAAHITEDAHPNPVSYYAVTKVMADRLMMQYDKALILRLRLPISDDNHPRNTLVKLAGYDRVVDAPNSVTDVDSLISAAWQLVKAEKFGVFNVVNPGIVSPYNLAVQMGRKPERLTPEGLNALTVAGRSNCVLSTAKLEAAGVKLEPASVVIARHVAKLRGKVA
jgi:dTDP-4-dehydrorhamnose reductase